MSDGFIINIGADVTDVERGMQRVESATRKAATSLQKLPNVTGQATQSLTNFSRVVQDAPFGIIGIANNIDPLLSSFQNLKASTGGVGGALKVLGSALIGPAGIAIAVSSVTSLLTVASQKYGSLGNAFNVLTGNTKALTEEQIKYNEAVRDSAVNVEKQKIELDQLVKFAKGDIGSKEEQRKALEKLNSLIPDYIGKLTAQNIATAQGAQILSKYVGELEKQATAELLVGRLAELNVKKLDTVNQLKQDLANNQRAILDTQAQINQLESSGKFTDTQIGALRGTLIDLKDARKDLLNTFADVRKGQNKEQEGLREVIGQNTTAIDFFKDDRSAAPAKEKAEKAGTDLSKIFAVARVKANDDFEKLIDETDANLDKFYQSVQTKASAQSLGLFNQRPEGERIGTGSLIFKGDLEAQQKALEAQNNLTNIQALTAGIADTALNSLAPAFGSVFTAVANGQSVFSSLTDVIGGVIKKLVSAVATAAALAAIFTLITGGAGAGGILGSLGKSFAAKGFASGAGGFGANFLKLFGAGFAEGGVSQGPKSGYLQLLHGTEYVIPKDKFNNLINNVQGAARGSQELFARISGQDIFLSNQRYVNG